MDNTDQNAGAAGDTGSGAPDLGTQNANGSQPSGTPGDQGGQQTDTRDAELATLRDNNRILNQRLVEAKKANSSQPQNADGTSPFDTPEGQYAISLELATGKVSRELSGRILPLYPELSPSEVQRIQKNPWAFASYDTFIRGDVDTALLEIEQALADRVAEIEAEKKGSQTPTQTPNPATLNSNPTNEPNVDAIPGSTEDEDPWTMPLDKLGSLKDKAVRKAQSNP